MPTLPVPERVIRTAYGPHYRVVKAFTQLSLTKQAMADSCNINFIMKRYRETGILEHVKQTGGTYEDLTDVPDYQTAMNKVIAANDAFGSLPAEIRKRFHNDPAEFLDFVGDAENQDEMRKMGLLRPVEDAVDPDDDKTGDLIPEKPKTPEKAPKPDEGD